MSHFRLLAYSTVDNFGRWNSLPNSCVRTTRNTRETLTVTLTGNCLNLTTTTTGTQVVRCTVSYGRDMYKCVPADLVGTIFRIPDSLFFENYVGYFLRNFFAYVVRTSNFSSGSTQFSRTKWWPKLKVVPHFLSCSTWKRGPRLVHKNIRCPSRKSGIWPDI